MKAVILGGLGGFGVGLIGYALKSGIQGMKDTVAILIGLTIFIGLAIYVRKNCH